MISRRSFFGGAALAGGVCLSAARAEDRSGACFCDPPMLPSDALLISDGTITVDLAKSGSFEATGASAMVKDDPRELRILLVHEAQGKYHAFSARCTHGGAPVGYDADRNRVQCVCYGHSMWAMDGALLKGPAKKPLPKYEASVDGGKLTVKL